MVFRTGIDQEEITRLELLIIFGVMKDTGILPTGDDAGIGEGSHAVSGKFMRELGLDVIFIKARSGGAHRPKMPKNRNRGGFPHDLDFLRRLVQALFVNQGLDIGEGSGRDRAGSGLMAKGSDGAKDGLVKFCILADGKINLLTIAKQPWQFRLRVAIG